MTNHLEYFKRMECTGRRPGAMHPDQCPKLRLHGVDFAIPPRGLRVKPSFDADGNATIVCDGVDEWPEIEALIVCIADQVKDKGLTLDTDDPTGILCKLMSLARKALLKQYDLTDDQMGELLAFATSETPEWINTLLRWAQGLKADFDPATAADIDWPEQALASEPVVETKRRWWQWRAR